MVESDDLPDRRRRILLVAYRFPPQGGGGVQRPAKYVKFWSEQGHRIGVLAGPDASGAPPDTSLLEDLPPDLLHRRVDDPGIPLRIRRWRSRIPSRGPGRILHRFLTVLGWLALRFSVPDPQCAWILPAFRAGLRLSESLDPELIYVTGPPWSPFLVGRLLAWRLGLPLVLDYRDPWTASYMKRAIRGAGLARWIDPHLERRIIRSASGWTAAHRAILAQLRRIGPNAIPRLWSPNGYDPDDLLIDEMPEEAKTTATVAPGGVRTTRPEPPRGRPDRFTLVYTGGFFRWRQPGTLFQVLDALLASGRIDPKRFEVRLAGSVKRARALCPADGPLRRVIVEHGYLPHRQGVALSASADLNLVLEADLEGHNHHTPGKFYELAYLRRPILLLSPPGVTPRLAQWIGGCLTAHPGDGVAIREAVLRLYQAWQEGLAPEVPSRERLRFYHRRHQAERVARFFERILSPAAASPEAASVPAGARRNRLA